MLVLPGGDGSWGWQLVEVPKGWAETSYKVNSSTVKFNVHEMELVYQYWGLFAGQRRI